MESYYCKKVSHEKQPITFAVQSNGKWDVCCGLCQFRSFLGKSNFIPIDDLETIFQDIKIKLTESNVVGILQESLFKLKEWHQEIENIISSIKDDLIQKLELYQHYIYLTEQNQSYFMNEINQLNEIMNLQDECDKKISKTSNELQELDEFCTKQLNILKNHPLSNNQVEVIKEVLTTKPNSIIEKQSPSKEKVNQQDPKKDLNQIKIPQESILEIKLAIKPNNASENQKQQDEKIIKKETYNILKLKDGIYEGNSSSGVPHGQGIMKFYNNQIYTGSWKEGKFDGKGILTISEEETYEGEFQNGKKQGKGTLTIKKGKNTIIFEGQFEQDMKSGRGKETSIETLVIGQDDPIDLTTSIFKQALNQKQSSKEKIIILEGEYQNNQKQEIFIKSSYENSKLISQKYCWYLNDEYQMDIDN